MKHISGPEKKAEIKAAFQNLQIPESEYLVLAGFNESLIEMGYGYLEEIHILCSVEIPFSPHLLCKLGKVLTPYPGILFLPSRSSGYETPVFKDDGTIWDYADLCFHRAKRYSDIRAKGIIHSEPNAFTSLDESQSSISVTVHALGRKEGSGNNKPGATSKLGISLDVQAKLFIGTSNSSSSKHFQELKINGPLTVHVRVLQLHTKLFQKANTRISQQIQTIPARLKPRRIPKSHVEFTKLNFQGGESVDAAYEQVYVRVEIDAKDENNVFCTVLQPLQTLASDPGPRITERHHDGVVSWGFFVDDMNERRTGIEFGRSQRAFPSVDVEFFGPSNLGPPSPPSDHFEVLLTSCWSLISPGHGSESYTTTSWLSWLKGLGSGTPASKVPFYSNLCQVVILEVPSTLSQEMPFRG